MFSISRSIRIQNCLCNLSISVRRLQMGSKQTSTKALFVGDSLTEWFQTTGKSSWKKHFQPLNPVNVGVAGDTTAQILARLRNGALKPLTSADVSILMAGTNDIGWGKEPPYIANQIQEIITVVQEQLPGTKILLLGILPRRSIEIATRVNQLISKFEDGETIQFLDMTPQFSEMDAQGKIDANPALYAYDQLHLSPEGYRIWAETMSPVLHEMLKK